jgi:hypothetical protein
MKQVSKDLQANSTPSLITFASSNSKTKHKLSSPYSFPPPSNQFATKSLSQNTQIHWHHVASNAHFFIRRSNQGKQVGK